MAKKMNEFEYLTRDTLAKHARDIVKNKNTTEGCLFIPAIFFEKKVFVAHPKMILPIKEINKDTSVEVVKDIVIIYFSDRMHKIFFYLSAIPKMKICLITKGNKSYLTIYRKKDELIKALKKEIFLKPFKYNLNN